jgi:hypothetical protein
LSAEWIGALAALGTMVVIGGTAIAALVQLRHMRGSNQIVALTECRETLESPEFRIAQRFVSFELPKRLADPVEREKATKIPYVGEYEAIGTVANFFESMGLFVKAGIIDRSIACDFWAFVILRNWNAMASIVTLVRHELGTEALWENFEYLAVLADDYQHAHPTTYPAGMRHMPADTSLIDAP